MDSNTEQKISAWSVLYGIDAETMQRMHSERTSLDTFYGNQELIDKVFRRNSQLLQEFLVALPAPTKLADKFCVQLDFMLPTPAAYSAIFTSLSPLHFIFEEKEDIGARYWDAQGVEYRYIPPKSKDGKAQNALPTYVKTAGSWKKGFQRLVEEELPRMLEKGYFVEGGVLGYCGNHRTIGRRLIHPSAGVNDPAIVYCGHDVVYSPSSSISEAEQGESLRVYYDVDTAKELEQRIAELDAKLFRKEERKRQNPYLGLLPSKSSDCITVE